jgi:hypothetical protein
VRGKVQSLLIIGNIVTERDFEIETPDALFLCSGVRLLKIMSTSDWIVQQWAKVGLKHFHGLEALIIEIPAFYFQRSDDVTWNYVDTINAHLGVKRRLMSVESTGSTEFWLWKYEDYEETLEWSDCSECVSSTSCMKMNMLG